MAANILVVDDDIVMREMLRVPLAAAGYAVRVAEDAREAGRMAIAQPPDLLIADVLMPWMDGFEFVAALRADRSLPWIPVIFITSVADGGARGRELGAVGYLVKPVRLDELLELVARNVPGGQG